MNIADMQVRAHFKEMLTIITRCDASLQKLSLWSSLALIFRNTSESLKMQTLPAAAAVCPHVARIFNCLQSAFLENCVHPKQKRYLISAFTVIASA